MATSQREPHTRRAWCGFAGQPRRVYVATADSPSRRRRRAATTPRFRSWAVSACVVLATVPGCSVLGDSADDVEAITMSRAEVVGIISGELEAVRSTGELMSEPIPQRYGCVSEYLSVPSGPPWWYKVLYWYDAPTAEQIAMWRTRIQGLSSKGYQQLPHGRRSDPRDVSIRNPQGFQVAMSFSSLSPDPAERVDITVTSPCVRHPDPADDSPS